MAPGRAGRQSQELPACESPLCLLTAPHSGSIGGSQALTSAVKNRRDTTTVFCTLFSRIHLVRGRSS